MHRALWLVLLVALPALAQEVAYLDLVHVTPRTGLRHPPLPPPKCHPDGACSISGFSVGVGIACGGTSAAEKRALRATLTWMDRTRYTEGDTAEFEVKLENSGSVPMSIPLTPHLADLQPADETAHFTALNMAINLELKWSGRNSVQIAHFDLYGSASNPGTLLTLEPGQWVRIRATRPVAMAAWQNAKLLEPGTEEHAFANFWMRSITYTPVRGGVSEDIANMYPLSLPGGELDIQLLPARAPK